MANYNEAELPQKFLPKGGKNTLGKMIGAYVIGSQLAGPKGSTHEQILEQKTADAIIDTHKQAAQHGREMQKGKQFHNQALEKQRFEADTVHEFATRYPHATEIKHGGTSVKFSKRGSSKPASPTTGSKPKNVKKTNNKKSK
jgi:hypothetical protein